MSVVTAADRSSRRRHLVPALAILCLSCGRINASQDGPGYTQPSAIDDGWRTARADAHGFDVARLEAMTAAITRENERWNVHAVLIERDGRLIYERYFSGPDERWGQSLGTVTFERSTLHDLRSVTKSIVSALIGVLIDGRALPGVDAPLAKYFPERTDLNETQRSLTLRHALTMTAGLEWNEDIPYTDPRNDEIVMTRSADPLRYVLTRPVVTAPGSTWRYNGGLTQVLAAVVERASMSELESYARKVLFTPLGIDRVEWSGNLAGMPSAASGLRLRARDLAKFGSLYLHQGRWNGTQVLPAAWVEESTRRHLTFPEQTMRGYAYHWWHSCIPSGNGAVEARVAQGNGGQRVVVLPALRAVVTIFAGRYNSGSNSEALVTDHIIPAFKTLNTLPAETACR